MSFRMKSFHSFAYFCLIIALNYSGTLQYYCSVTPSHTLCLYEVGSINETACEVPLRRDVTKHDRKIIVTLHNKFRKQAAEEDKNLESRPDSQSSGTYVMKLEWDEELALIAQTWANQCQLFNDCFECRATNEFHVGQNLYIHRSKGEQDPDWEHVIRTWYNQAAVININSGETKSQANNHFEARKIGCGYIAYKQEEMYSYLYICNYGPVATPGNFDLQKKIINGSQYPEQTNPSYEYQRAYKGMVRGSSENRKELQKHQPKFHKGPSRVKRDSGNLLEEHGRVPWQVSIQTIRREHFCSGVIVDKNWVLTSADCVHETKETPSKIVVVVGEYDLDKEEVSEQVLQVLEIILHEDFKKREKTFNLALLQLNNGIQYNEHVERMCLSKIQQSTNSFCIVSGWGSRNGRMHNSSRISTVMVPPVQHRICYRSYFALLSISSKMMCVGEDDKQLCQGDSGAPLVCVDDQLQAHLTGVVAYMDGCGRPSYPGIYTNMSYYIPWIFQHAPEIPKDDLCPLPRLLYNPEPSEVATTESSGETEHPPVSGSTNSENSTRKVTIAGYHGSGSHIFVAFDIWVLWLLLVTLLQLK